MRDGLDWLAYAALSIASRGFSSRRSISLIRYFCSICAVGAPVQLSYDEYNDRKQFYSIIQLDVDSNVVRSILSNEGPDHMFNDIIMWSYIKIILFVYHLIFN